MLYQTVIVDHYLGKFTGKSEATIYDLHDGREVFHTYQRNNDAISREGMKKWTADTVELMKKLTEGRRENGDNQAMGAENL